MKEATQREQPFDARKGRQELSTGTLGGILALCLIASFGRFSLSLEDGGPALQGVYPWLLPMFQFATVKRDFFTLMSVLVLVFLFMGTWELRRGARPLALGIACTTVIASLWAAPHLTGGLTGFEQILLAGSVGLALLWVPKAVRSKPRIPWKQALITSFWRWTAGLIAFEVVMLTAFGHPYYRDGYFENWRIGCALFFSACMLLGLPYAVITNLAGASFTDNTRDPGFMLMLLARSVPRGSKVVFSRLSNRRTGTLLRDLLVKLFFVPLMIVFFYGNCGNFLRSLHAGAASFDQFYLMAYWGILVIDVSLTLIGYVGTLRCLGNKSVSVEPTMLGWMVALACYPPFNQITDTYLPYSRSLGIPWFEHPGAWLDILCKLGVLILMGIYAWATMAFGCRFSNLTNRGIVTRGPYGLIRHPAYACKNLAWWLESVRCLASVWQLLFLAGFNALYLLRALTEERHLRQDPDYEEYCKLVRYRFIPGLL